MSGDLVTKDGQELRKGRIKPALRTAIRLIVEQGLSQADAAKRVGMRPASLTVALRKPHVKVVVAAVKRAWLDSETSKSWRTVAELAAGAASEDVRLKAAKVFLEAAGELGGASAAAATVPALVQIVLNHVPAKPEPLSHRLPGVIEHEPNQRDRPEPSNLITVGRSAA